MMSSYDIEDKRRVKDEGKEGNRKKDGKRQQKWKKQKRCDSGDIILISRMEGGLMGQLWAEGKRKMREPED